MIEGLSYTVIESVGVVMKFTVSSCLRDKLQALFMQNPGVRFGELLIGVLRSDRHDRCAQ